jgi:hypothetical protein
MSPVVALNPQIKHYPHRHTVALLRAMILTMIESYADGLQSPAVALMHSPLKRLVVPAVVIFTLAGMAGCLAYFVVAPTPVSQPAALAAPSATEALSSTVGLARATGTLTVADRLRPSGAKAASTKVGL